MTHKCWGCQEVEIEEPIRCCDGYMCGCGGYPINPPYCDECWAKISGQEKVKS